jgi:hypothetical protein
MTTFRDPDDLASALLDGLLDEDEAAAARRDPAVASRMAELAAAREAMATPPAGPDPVARERAVAAALGAYDAGDERHDADTPVGVAVTPMHRWRRRARPATSGTGTPGRAHAGARQRWFVAAAVVLAVVGLGFVVRNLDTGGDEGDTAAQEAVTDRTSNAGGGTGGAAEDTEAGGEGTAAAGEAPGIVDLGEVDSSEALADRARSILAERFASPQAGAPSGEASDEQGGGADLGAPPATCGDDAAAQSIGSASEPIVLRAQATLDGKAVDVWVVGAQDEERVIAIDASCAVVVDRPLQP